MRFNSMPNKKKQRGSAFFGYMVEKFGVDFLNKVPPLDIKKKVYLLFKDLAHGTVDMEKYGKYFESRDFITIIAEESARKRFYYGLHVQGYELSIQYNPQYSQYLYFDECRRQDLASYNAYVILNDGFNYILNSGDSSNIAAIVSSLRNYKWAL